MSVLVVTILAKLYFQSIHDDLARNLCAMGDPKAIHHVEISIAAVKARFGDQSVEYAHELVKLLNLKINHGVVCVGISGFRYLTAV